MFRDKHSPILDVDLKKLSKEWKRFKAPYNHLLQKNYGISTTFFYEKYGYDIKQIFYTKYFINFVKFGIGMAHLPRVLFGKAYFVHVTLYDQIPNSYDRNNIFSTVLVYDKKGKYMGNIDPNRSNRGKYDFMGFMFTYDEIESIEEFDF